MKSNIIYQDKTTVVKEVWVAGKFMYTVTYKLDEDGCVNKMIRVYKDGSVEIQ